MPVTIGNTTITGLAAGGLPAGSITAANMASSGSWAPSGTIISITPIRSSSRTSVSGQGSNFPTGYKLWSGSFTKLRADTDIYVYSHQMFQGWYSGNCAVGLNMDNSNSLWDYGHGYQYDGNYGPATIQPTGCSRWTGLSAGSHTVYFGWNPNGGGANTPGNIWNPNNNEDNRDQQRVSSMIVYEVVP